VKLKRRVFAPFARDHLSCKAAKGAKTLSSAYVYLQSAIVFQTRWPPTESKLLNSGSGREETGNLLAANFIPL
jgi:hypothetical protein